MSQSNIPEVFLDNDEHAAWLTTGINLCSESGAILQYAKQGEHFSENLDAYLNEIKDAQNSLHFFEQTLRNLAETESDLELRANAVSGLTVILESIILKLENTL